MGSRGRLIVISRCGRRKARASVISGVGARGLWSSMTPNAKILAAQTLCEQGFSNRKIAQALNISPTSVRRWLDPDYAERDRIAARKYKQQRTGICKECGGVTRYNGHKNPVSDICAACLHNVQHDARHWTQERIIEAIRRFVSETGRIPVSSEWLRNCPDGCPSIAVVQREFGTWAAGVRAAGFDIPGVGKYERSEETRAKLSASLTRWTPEKITDQIKEWVEEHGEVPAYMHWVARGTPSITIVVKVFGTWREAVEAAGFEPRLLPRGSWRAGLNGRVEA